MDPKANSHDTRIRWAILLMAVAIASYIALALVAFAPRVDAAVESGSTTVSFNIAEAIEVTAWPSATFTLAEASIPGVAVVSDVMSVTVRANAPWGLQVSSDTDGGMLREWDAGTASYVAGGAMSGPVMWATNVNGPWTPVAPIPSTMFTGMPPTGVAGQSVGFVLRVTPTFDDQPLPAGREYRIVLMYTAGVGF